MNEDDEAMQSPVIAGYVEQTALFRHVSEILLRGATSVPAAEFDDLQQLTATMQCGTRMRRLDSIKTALLMLETLGLMSSTNDENMAVLVGNFVNYLFETLPAPLAVAIIMHGSSTKQLKMQAAAFKGPQLARFRAAAVPMLVKSETAADMKQGRQATRCKKNIRLASRHLENLRAFASNALTEPESFAAIGLTLLF
jgi:hypothetical protein